MYSDYEIDKLKRAIQYLTCKVKNGGGGTETDPVFRASPAYTITQSDIDNWNLEPIIPTLQQVTTQGNTTDKPITSTSIIQGNSLEVNTNGFTGGIEGSSLTEARNYFLPNNSGTFALLSDIPIKDDTLNSVTTRGSVTTNSITVGGFKATSLIQQDNTYIRNLVAKSDGTFGWEDIITHYNTARSSYYSGRYGNMMTANGLLNMFIGGSSSTLKDLTTITGQENTLLTYSDTFDLTSGSGNLGIGYQSGSQLNTGSWNIFLGRRAGKNITTGTNNVIIGSNGASGTDTTFSTSLTNYIQILSGTAPTITPANNKLNIGNWIFGDNGNIGIGVAPLEKLDINGNIRARSLLNAQGDATFTKNIVAKADGTFGVENKTVSTLFPKVDIIDYVTTDAVNYILRVRVSNLTTLSYSGAPYFNVSAFGGNSVNATNLTTVIDNFQRFAYTPNPAGGNVGGFADCTITFPKSSNTSPVWSNPLVAISVTWTASDTVDGGVNSPYNPRRIGNDTRVIGQLNPKQDAFTEIKEFSDNFSGSTITLTNTPKAGTIISVIRGGSVLREGSGRDYTISGKTITFTSAQSAVNIEINYKY